MADPAPVHDFNHAAGALWQRLAGPSAILDQAALVRQSAARVVAELLMCDPAYVLTVAGRERPTGPEPDSGTQSQVPGGRDSSP